MSKQLTAEAILKSYFSDGKGVVYSKRLDKALAQLHQSLKERMPEKWENLGKMLDADAHTSWRFGYNQALDEIEKILNDFFKGGK